MASSGGQQTSVDLNAPAGFAGMLGEGSHKTRSYHNEESTAVMPFGIMIARGTSDPDEGALLPHTSAAAMAAAFAGVVLHSHHYDEEFEIGAGAGTLDDGLNPDVTLKVLTHGTVWVLPEEAVTPASDVRVRVVAGATEQAGAFRATADDVTDCVDVSAFCRWLTSAGAGEPALLEINMTLASQGVADS